MKTTRWDKWKPGTEAIPDEVGYGLIGKVVRATTTSGSRTSIFKVEAFTRVTSEVPIYDSHWVAAGEIRACLDLPHPGRQSEKEWLFVTDVIYETQEV